MKKEKIQVIIKLIITILTAIVTSLGVNSCCQAQKKIRVIRVIRAKNKSLPRKLSAPSKFSAPQKLSAPRNGDKIYFVKPLNQ